MALWKESPSPRKDAAGVSSDLAPRVDSDSPAELAYSREAQRRSTSREPSESVLGPELTIEGKIDGSGNLRIAGRFTGDVTVDGNLTIESGARLAGGVRAHAVVIAGELEGNVLDAGRVELQSSGVLIGDLKAGSLTVAAGSRMRGRVEFGWGEGGASPAKGAKGNGAAP